MPQACLSFFKTIDDSFSFTKRNRNSQRYNSAAELTNYLLNHHPYAAIPIKLVQTAFSAHALLHEETHAFEKLEQATQAIIAFIQFILISILLLQQTKCRAAKKEEELCLILFWLEQLYGGLTLICWLSSEFRKQKQSANDSQSAQAELETPAV